MRPRLLALAITAALASPLVAACSGSAPRSGNQPPLSPSALANAVHGPLFPECGGVSDQTLSQLTKIPGLVSTARNSVGCQWLPGGLYGPAFWFAWYRGSPIGREPQGGEGGGPSPPDIPIDGHNGFIAAGDEPRDNYCSVGIQFGDDFFEWAVRFYTKPFPDPCDVAKELAHQSIAAAKGPDR